MYNESILPQELKTFDYYKNKLPLVLQNSYGFLEHYRIWFDLLTNSSNSGIVEIGDLILYLMNIFDSDYLNTIRDLDDSGSTSLDDYGTTSDILDKIGNLFGLSRIVFVDYTYEGVHTQNTITLNNEEFLIYIKCQIIRNYCDGSFSQIAEYYRAGGLLVYVITAAQSATCKLFLYGYYPENIIALFLSGLLRIESMGIIYQYGNVSGSTFLIWDDLEEDNSWDYGVWTT